MPNSRNHSDIIITATLSVMEPLLIKKYEEIQSASPFIIGLKDTKGNPYIPGSTLKGWLAAQLDENKASPLYKVLKRISGSKKDKLTSNTESIFSNAYLNPKSDFKTAMITRTSIDPLTKTAKDSHLFTAEYITVADFDFKLRFNNVRDDLLNGYLVELSNILNLAQIGSNKNSGFGFIEFSDVSYSKLTHSDLRDSIREGSDPIFTGQSPLGIKSPSQKGNTISIKLHSSEPYILNALDVSETNIKARDLGDKDKKFALETVEKNQKKASTLYPDLYKNNEGAFRNYIPDLNTNKPTHRGFILGPTIKGHFRHKCAQVINLLNNENGFSLNEGLIIDSLFGSTTAAGKLKFTTLYTQENPTPGVSTFNAVNRHSQEVRDKSLFSCIYHCLKPNDFFIGNITFKELSKDENLILAVLFRDYIEDGLSIGHRKNSGFGHFNTEFIIHMELTTSEISFDNNYFATEYIKENL